MYKGTAVLYSYPLCFNIDAMSDDSKRFDWK